MNCFYRRFRKHKHTTIENRSVVRDACDLEFLASKDCPAPVFPEELERTLEPGYDTDEDKKQKHADSKYKDNP